MWILNNLGFIIAFVMFMVISSCDNPEYIEGNWENDEYNIVIGKDFILIKSKYHRYRCYKISSYGKNKFFIRHFDKNCQDSLDVRIELNSELLSLKVLDEDNKFDFNNIELLRRQSKLKVETDENKLKLKLIEKIWLSNRDYVLDFKNSKNDTMLYGVYDSKLPYLYHIVNNNILVLYYIEGSCVYCHKMNETLPIISVDSSHVYVINSNSDIDTFTIVNDINEKEITYKRLNEEFMRLFPQKK